MGFRRAVRVHVLARWKELTQHRDFQRYFATHTVRKINLGCGSNCLEGWLNADLYPRFGSVFMDGARRWPVPDGTFDALLCEHMIEHVSKDLGRHLIEEAFRTLAPGGRVRFITPDLSTFSRMILAPQDRDEGEGYLDVVRKFFSNPSASWCDAMNYCFYGHGHRYIYSPEELRLALTAAGFISVVETRAASPKSPVFEGVEGHVKVVGLAADVFEAFALEACKPLDGRALA